jgi:gamma-glutamylcyclotransferase (GGCT)/AIG2-like uncharacterized protein YtfP
MTHVTIFAFGSNLDRAQMRARCPSAAAIARATLPHHGLLFAGFSSRWGGAVASVVRDRRRSVPGVLYVVSREDLVRLDRFEGVPYCYDRVTRVVVDEDDRRRRVQLYALCPGWAEPGLPSASYLGVILKAYRRLGFDRRALLATALEAA